MAEGLEAQLETLTNENAFLKKYFSLRKKCEQLQQANEKIVNRIQHVKKLIKRYKRERRFLTSRLDEYGDPYQDTQVPYMWEEDQVFNKMRQPPPYKQSAMKSLDKPSKSKAQDSILNTINPLLAAHGLPEIGSQSAGTSGSATKAKKSKSDKEKDPSAPKKPANAFLMFCMQQRTSVQEAYFQEFREEISNHELTKRLAHRWNGLQAEEKRIFYSKYEMEKERYDREMKEYHDRESSASAANTSVHVTSEPVATEVNMAAMGLEAQSAVDALMMDS